MNGCIFNNLCLYSIYPIKLLQIFVKRKKVVNNISLIFPEDKKSFSLIFFCGQIIRITIKSLYSHEKYNGKSLSK